jgi:hypothetical protein
MKYGSGMVFHRPENLEKNLGTPLPAAMQWEIVEEAAELMRPAYEELVRKAAQGEVLHNDRGPREQVFVRGVERRHQNASVALSPRACRPAYQRIYFRPGLDR